MDAREYAYEGRWWTNVRSFKAETKEESVFKGATIPIEYKVCHVCHGRGEYVNPSIDAHGITREEMDELGEDFAEDYREGFFNIPCGLCKGASVVPNPIVPVDIAALTGDEDERYEYAQEREMEVRMGY